MLQFSFYILNASAVYKINLFTTFALSQKALELQSRFPHIQPDELKSQKQMRSQGPGL